MIGQFLLETWQLLYWSMLAPSKLQRRMNEWMPKKDEKEQGEDTRYFDFFPLNFCFLPIQIRFISQFFILIACLSLPLFYSISQSDRLIDWLLPILVFPATYSLAVWSLPLALSIPIACWRIYCEFPELWSRGVYTALDRVLPLHQLLTSISIYVVCLGLTVFSCSSVSKLNLPWLTRCFYVILGSLSVAASSWSATYDSSSTILFSVLVFFLLILSAFRSTNGISLDIPSLGRDFAIGVAVLIVLTTQIITESSLLDASVLETGIFSVIAIFPTIFASLIFSLNVSGRVQLNTTNEANWTVEIAGFAFLINTIAVVTGFLGLIPGFFSVGVQWLWTDKTFLLILVGCTLLARWYGQESYKFTHDTNAPSQEASKKLPDVKSGGWAIALSTMTLTAGLLDSKIAGSLNAKLNLQEWLIIPISILLSYYHVFPEYILSIATVFTKDLLFKGGNSLELLNSLPPNSNQRLWIPIPQHDHILVKAFQQNAAEALFTFQQMQTSSYPGFRRTVSRAFSKIVSNQLIEITTTSQLIQIASLEHSILPVMLPAFYQGTDTEASSATNVTKTTTDPEIAIIFPKLKAVAQDVDKALKAGSIALRQRNLEEILNRLKLQELQLTGLGLTGTSIPRWQVVIRHWQQIIQQELEVQQKQSQGELLNPFQYGNPLRRDREDLFKGRQAFADEIVRLVLDRNRPTLVLHGPRRCGKSSFLYNLPRLLPSNILPIYVDMQSAAVRTDEAAFCQGLARAIHRDVQGIDLPVVPSRSDFLSSPYIVLEDWLAEVTSKLENKRLLLNLDEFEKIGEAIHEKRFSIQVFDELRSLIQHWEQLGFLFSGVQTLDELGPNWSSYFISVVPIEMLYLEPKEAEELLRDPDPKFALQYDVGIVETIIELTRCQPYLLQLLGSALVTQANRQSTQLITAELLQVAIQDAFTNGTPYFTNVWTEFTGSNPAEVAAGQQLLLAIAQEDYCISGDSDPVVQAALKRLRRYHVIEQVNESDQIEIPLLKQWILERAIEA